MKILGTREKTSQCLLSPFDKDIFVIYLIRRTIEKIALLQLNKINHATFTINILYEIP